MATRLPSKRHAAGGSLIFIGPTSKLNQFFVPTSLTLESATTPEVVASEVKRHKRRRYPGDPGVDVEAHGRVSLRGGTKSGAGAQPGNPFYCERPVGTGGNAKVKVVKFSYIGTWSDLRTFAKTNVTGGNFVLRNSTGEAEEIID